MGCLRGRRKNNAAKSHTNQSSRGILISGKGRDPTGG